MADVDGTVVEEPGVEVELVRAPAPATNLFRTDNPVEVVQRASEVADALKAVLKTQGLTQQIQGREFVKVEGWTTCGAMLGVVPVVAWTRKVDDGWEARVEARTLDGRVIGAAEAECLRSERAWKSRDDYALRSMAQTRATSKALRGPLGFIVTLAGFEATPSEEIPADDRQPFRRPQAPGVVETGKSDVTPDEDPWVLFIVGELEAHGLTKDLRNKLSDLGHPPAKNARLKSVLRELPTDVRGQVETWVSSASGADVPFS